MLSDLIGLGVATAALVAVGVAFGYWRGRRDSAILSGLLLVGLVSTALLSRHAIVGSHKPAWQYEGPQYTYGLLLLPILIGVSGFVLFGRRKLALVFSSLLGGLLSIASSIVLLALGCYLYYLCP